MPLTKLLMSVSSFVLFIFFFFLDICLLQSMSILYHFFVVSSLNGESTSCWYVFPFRIMCFYPRNLLTRWDVSSIPANGIFLTKN